MLSKLLQYELSDKYSILLISHCGNSVRINIGRYNGVFSEIKGDGLSRIFFIDYANHRVKLAIFAAYKVESYFKEVDTFLLCLSTVKEH